MSLDQQGKPAPGDRCDLRHFVTRKSGKGNANRELHPGGVACLAQSSDSVLPLEPGSAGARDGTGGGRARAGRGQCRPPGRGGHAGVCDLERFRRRGRHRDAVATWREGCETQTRTCRPGRPRAQGAWVARPSGSAAPSAGPAPAGALGSLQGCRRRVPGSSHVGVSSHVLTLELHFRKGQDRGRGEARQGLRAAVATRQ